MRIFEHNFVADKAKIRRRAAARQGFLTQYAAKFAEKTCAYAYEDRFLYSAAFRSEYAALFLAFMAYFYFGDELLLPALFCFDII